MKVHVVHCHSILSSVAFLVESVLLTFFLPSVVAVWLSVGAAGFGFGLGLDAFLKKLKIEPFTATLGCFLVATSDAVSAKNAVSSSWPDCL